MSVRPLFRPLGTMLIVAVVAAGFLSGVHHHAGAPGSDHCAVCIAGNSSAVAPATSFQPPRLEARPEEPRGVEKIRRGEFAPGNPPSRAPPAL